MNLAIQSQSLNRYITGTEKELYYEHFILGEAIVIHSLSVLFTLMLQENYIPVEMKKSIIVTIHKGKNKRTVDLNNFRAITLIPTVLKLYESVSLGRSSKIIPQNINSQHVGFQDGLGSIMTSFSTQRKFTL